MHLHDLTIKKFNQGLVNKEFTALEMVQQLYKFIEKEDKKINSYLSLDKEAAYLQAEAADLAIAKGKGVGPLTGVPLAIKDNILIADQPATAASKMLENYTATYDATVIRKLRNEGAVFLGKTNMDEFAMGSSTENSAFGNTKNPHDPKLVPGGSSGGSAAAVAAHLAVASLGSDTGGSIRQPADFCQVVALKPTYGAVSRYGLIAMASSLDQIGPITKNVEDAATLFQAISGHDEKDATSSEVIYGDELSNHKIEKLKKMVIGLPKEYFDKGVDKEIIKKVKKVVKDLESLGIKFKEISLPHTKYAISCYYIIMPAEVSANLARFDGIRYSPLEGVKAKNLADLYLKNRSKGFGKEVKRRIMLGTFVLSSGYYDAYYAKAQKVRSLIKQDFDQAFKDVDVILTPVSPTKPFKFKEKTKDPLSMYMTDVLTVPANLAGLPALSMPPGFQLIGQHWREADILNIGHYYEHVQNSG
ncbi:TPA: Asp-tRNA(Asn)/Glu-tRNA(Gln) amidotransferase GatCAB subunit A [Patescibacteria group bacterium]|nr:Asp-tRNA(Asn)/Glu-tRNA(Gln) amidotransferase GatCAB subunit A [Patescibacteria group bacterium]